MIQTLLVSATRRSRQEFWRTSLLGQSLLQFPASLRPTLALKFDNHGPDALGLSAIYNHAIESAPRDRHLLFVHDDVWLHDVFLQYRIAEGLNRADVIGLAGSAGSDPNQPSWGLAFDDHFECQGWQKPEHVTLSGAVSHTSKGAGLPRQLGEAPAVQLSEYGTLPARCDLLDGLFLAANVERLWESGVRFDERFDFHFYDLDFCATARAQGLRLMTWPILCTHGSGGNFSTPEWKAAARLYLDKWRDAERSHAPASTVSLPLPSPPLATPAEFPP